MYKIGDIVLLETPYKRRSGGKYQPALVMSVDETEKQQGCLDVAYITGELDTHADDDFSVAITQQDLANGTLELDCVVRVDRTMTIYSKQCRKVASLGAAKCDEVLRKSTRHRVRAFAKHKFSTAEFLPGQTTIPASGKVIGTPELENMVEASLDGWLTTGRFNEAFEKRLAGFLDAKHVLTTNSGSSANLLALAALTSYKLGEKALKSGDEIITVAAGFPTTVNPALQYGLVPVFVDVHIPTYNIDPAQIEAAVSDRTRAIMIAHTLGNPFDLDEVMRVARKYGLWVIEDCCDALGSTYCPRGGESRFVGSFGDIGTLSFYPAHHITMGEGGAVFTNNGKLKPIIESFRDWGRDCFCEPGKDNSCGKRFCWKLGSLPYGYDHKYTYSHVGYNLKISDMQAAVGLAQMDRLDGFIQSRKVNFDYLKARFAHLQDYLILPEATHNSTPSWFGFPITLRDDVDIDRVELLSHLDRHKIGTRLVFAGNLTCQPYMADRKFRISGELINTDRVMNRSFWLGVYPGLNTAMLDYAAEQVEKFIKHEA